MPEMTLDHSLTRHFSTLEDPRCALKRRHNLLDMIVIAIAATLCGADGWVRIEAFGRAKQAWPKQFSELPDGIPSHDTFGRVFSLLQPEAFEACFRDWVEAIREVIPGEVIAIDGKTLRRSHDRGKGLAALHPVSAWATANRVVLGQVATEAKSNEITAIPQVLDLLHLNGCIVTIDAMGCRTAIAEQIVAQGGRYVLALKGNQSTLATEVEEAFIDADAREYTDVASALPETTEQLHWSLDVAFREDASRVRDPEARENPALIRRVALTRLQHDDSKLGIQSKRLKAGWDERYLYTLLFDAPKISPKKTASKGSNIRKT